MEETTKEIMKDIDCENLINKLDWHPNKIWGQRPITDINKIIIHQSLSDGKIENINRYIISPGNHISTNGCPHIPYHIAINKDGEILICNNFDDRTWHTKGVNRVSLGVCVLGNFIGTGYNKGHEPTEKQLLNLELLIEYLLDKLSLTSKSVYGHYHFGKPACPGKSCSEIVEAFRTDKRFDEERHSIFNRLDSIKDIQEALMKINVNWLTVYGADGIMGEETKKAIVQFQTNMQIPITGLADEITRAEIIKRISLTGV
jgi:N-acetyl-anhydromuramyl-L-alanine amidase AmpD